MLRVVFKNPPTWEDRIIKGGFKFIDKVNRPSRAIFQIDNYDYKYSDLKQHKKNFKFCFGEWGIMSKWFKTDIISVKGSRTLTIEMHTMETRLMTKKHSRFYEDTTLEDILITIANEWGLVPVYDKGVKGLMIQSMSQMNESDAQFLRRLAEMTCFNFWIDGDSLHFTAETQSDMYTIPYGELIEEPDFEFNFRKLRGKPKWKAVTKTYEFGEQYFDLEEFNNQFGSYEGPQSVGTFNPETDPADSTSNENKILYEDYSSKTKQTGGATVLSGIAGAFGDVAVTAVKDKGPKHDENEIVARTEHEAAKLAAKKVLKMTMKLPAIPRLWAGDSIELIDAPDCIEGQWFIREHEYNWPVSTLRLHKRGLKKKLEKKKLEAAKEKIEYEASSELNVFLRDPNTSYDPALWEKQVNKKIAKETKVVYKDYSYTYIK